MTNRVFVGVCTIVVAITIVLATVGVPGSDGKRAQESDTTARALRDLASRTEAGISYSSFSDRLGDARSAIDAYEHDYGSDGTSAVFESAYKEFAFSRKVWDEFKSVGSALGDDDSVILLKYYSCDHVINNLLARHPEVESDEAVTLQRSLSALWTDAREALDQLPKT